MDNQRINRCIEHRRQRLMAVDGLHLTEMCLEPCCDDPTHNQMCELKQGHEGEHLAWDIDDEPMGWAD